MGIIDDENIAVDEAYASSDLSLILSCTLFSTDYAATIGLLSLYSSHRLIGHWYFVCAHQYISQNHACTQSLVSITAVVALAFIYRGLIPANMK